MKFATILLGLALFTIATSARWWDDEFCGPIVGTWSLSTSRTGAALRPVIYTISADGTVAINAGSNIVNAGFDDRSGGLGECRRTSENRYRISSSELLYREGLLAGRFEIELNVIHDPLTDTFELGFSGEASSFNLYVYSDNAVLPAPACLTNTDNLPTGDITFGGPNERLCLASDDLEATARRLVSNIPRYNSAGVIGGSALLLALSVIANLI